MAAQPIDIITARCASEVSKKSCALGNFCAFA
jgi:hypothetical protein